MEPTVGKVGLQQIPTSGPSRWEYWLPAAHGAFLERETISPGLSPDAILTFYMFFSKPEIFWPSKSLLIGYMLLFCCLHTQQI